MKSIPASNHSLGNRIKSFVNAYSKATDTEAPADSRERGPDSDATSVVSGLHSGGGSVVTEGANETASSSAQPLLDSRAAPKILSLHEVGGQKTHSTTASSVGSHFNVNENHTLTGTSLAAGTASGAEAGSKTPDRGGGEISPMNGQWDTVGRAVAKYEDKMAASRSEQALQTTAQVQAQEAVLAAAAAAAAPRDDKQAHNDSTLYANADAFNAAFHEACIAQDHHHHHHHQQQQQQQQQPGDNASVSSMGQLSVRSGPLHSTEVGVADTYDADAAVGGVGMPSLTATASQELLLEPSQTYTGDTGRTSKYPLFTGGVD